MKIKPEHYQAMKAAIATLSIEDHKAAIVKDGRYKDFDKRLRWDLCHAAKLTPFLCNTLYTYLNDTHIDTALKSIVYELQATKEEV